MAILKAPAEPQEISGTANAWDIIESQLGSPLPKDYKDFVNAFGTGSINGFIVVLNPFSSNKFANLLERGQLELEAYATLKTEFPQYYTHDVYPASDGLLPFAITDNGDVFYWQTLRAPEYWRVIAYEARGPEYYIFNGPMTDFISALLTQSIECRFLPRNLTHHAPYFRCANQANH